jgi:hypothetical protein
MSAAPGAFDWRRGHECSWSDALLGHVSAVEPDCPLVPAGVSATVRSAPDRFAVDIKGSSPEVVKEIEARTRRLLGNRWID